MAVLVPKRRVQTVFDYDAVGNRTVVVHTTGTNAPVNTNYTANILNQYTGEGGNAVAADTNGNFATTVSGTCAYDAQPRREGSAAVDSRIANPKGDRAVGNSRSQNRLTSVNSGTNTVSLAYDGLNRAVTRTVNGTATHLIYDRDWNVIEEYDGSGVQLAAMAYGAATDEPIFRWASGPVLSYYHQDALGNVTTLTDTSGIPVENYRYDIYGQPTIYDPYLSVRATSFFGNPYMFTGREYLAEAGLYQYRNRAYSPELGRFLQTDPIGFAAGDENLYRYVANNPISAVDPWGLAAYFSVGDGHGEIAVDFSPGNVLVGSFSNGSYTGPGDGHYGIDQLKWAVGPPKYTTTVMTKEAFLKQAFDIYEIPQTKLQDRYLAGKILMNDFLEMFLPPYRVVGNNCGDKAIDDLISAGHPELIPLSLVPFLSPNAYRGNLFLLYGSPH